MSNSTTLASETHSLVFWFRLIDAKYFLVIFARQLYSNVKLDQENVPIDLKLSKSFIFLAVGFARSDVKEMPQNRCQEYRYVIFRLDMCIYACYD